MNAQPAVAAAADRIAAPITWASAELIHEVTQFLNYESELLDSWRLDEWLNLFTPDCSYLVPSTDRPDGNEETDLFFVRDDWFLLSQRVAAIMDGTAWTESPRSVTKRIITNIRAHTNSDESLTVKFNFLISRSALSTLDFYPGECQLQLVRGGHAGFEIKSRRSTLALAQLRPHGRVSIIL